MGSLASRLLFLFVISSMPVASSEANLPLEANLKSWNRLKREAGYYTESGSWRGGLYRRSKTIETEHYECLNHTDTHCTDWSVSERNTKKHETGNCTCEETASPFCQHWTCSTTFGYECGTEKQPQTCVAEETLNCNCSLPAVNKRYCWRWQCREDSTTRGGHHEDEVYECLVGDLTAEYCFRWGGNISSKYQIESSACECSERGHGFCEAWMCLERGIGRCDQSRLGWCRLQISVGVGGGMGLSCFALSLMGLQWIRACQTCQHPEDADQRVEVKHILICFILFCLPWFAGVVVWGGIFGFPFVLVLWSVVLASAILAIKRAERKRNGLRVELPRIQLPKIQLPLPLAVKTKSIDDSRSDKPNDVRP